VWLRIHFLYFTHALQRRALARGIESGMGFEEGITRVIPVDANDARSARQCTASCWYASLLRGVCSVSKIVRPRGLFSGILVLHHCYVHYKIAWLSFVNLTFCFIAIQIDDCHQHLQNLFLNLSWCSNTVKNLSKNWKIFASAIFVNNIFFWNVYDKEFGCDVAEKVCNARISLRFYSYLIK